MRAAAAGGAPWPVVKGVFCRLLGKIGVHRVSLRAFNEYLHICQLALPPGAVLPEMIAGLRWMAQAGTVHSDDDGGTVHADDSTVHGDNEGTVHGNDRMFCPQILPDAATLNTLMPAMRRAGRAAAGLLLHEMLVGGMRRGGRGVGRSAALTRLTVGDWADFGRTGRLLVLERALQDREGRRREGAMGGRPVGIESSGGDGGVSAAGEQRGETEEGSTVEGGGKRMVGRGGKMPRRTRSVLA
ncbi:hypothetical protein CLOM_g10653 [Closterium sp. NIES-68]|nr:hypothetical protein CLOM_g10653 [Closterium sp. NIES-68]